MEISFSSNSITGDHITTKFGTCHDSPAVVPCAKFCSDHFISIWMRAKLNFHHIWIVMEKLLVKWSPGPEWVNPPFSQVVVYIQNKKNTKALLNMVQAKSQFADNKFKVFVVNENCCILIHISLQIVPEVLINNKSALAWRRILSVPVMACFTDAYILLSTHPGTAIGGARACRWKHWLTPYLFFVNSHILSHRQQSSFSPHLEILYQ